MGEKPKFDVCMEVDDELVNVGALWDQDSRKVPLSGVLRLDEIKDAVEDMDDDDEQARLVLFGRDADD